jgi:hypothetical protein
MGTRAGLIFARGLSLLLGCNACISAVTDEAGVIGDELRRLPDEGQPGPNIEGPIDPAPAGRPPRDDLPEVDLVQGDGFADLTPDGSIRYIAVGSATYDLQINVVNIGTNPTQGSATRVSLNGQSFDATLYHYWDGTYDFPNVVSPDKRGYLIVKNYRSDVGLSPCQPVKVQIDIDQRLQYGRDLGGSYEVNDTQDALFYATGFSCPLTWTTRINAATTGIEPDSTVGDDHGTGFSLQAIVSSHVSGRQDGQRCSACHNYESTDPFEYNPQIPPGGFHIIPVEPFDPISDGEAWVGGSSPWINKFLMRPEKTPYLKAVFSKWLSDGATH